LQSGTSIERYIVYLQMELLEITFKDLLNPEFYINNGGLWLFLFIVFAETGLFAGFFLPGDTLLFVGGIFSTKLVTIGLGIDLGSDLLHLLILAVLVAIAGILGNEVGYWFGKKSGPTLYSRKDSFFFKKKYLQKAHDFYEEKGTWMIVIARFLPIIRTFAPIVAGIVQMDKKKFTFYNIAGSIAWSFSLLFAGHYLQKVILEKFGIDLIEHLEYIIIGIVVVTTAPVLYKLFFAKKKILPPTGDNP
jgi:membrane-associated protein